MNRKEFLKTCGFACLGAGSLSVILQGCAGSKIITAQLVGEYIVVPIAEFELVKKNEKTMRKYLVVQNSKLKYPVCLYRNSDTDYTALLMQCTHQNNELTAYGDKLHCSAHGSEFDKNGKMTNGPAEKNLRSFPVIVEADQLKISLKA